MEISAGIFKVSRNQLKCDQKTEFFGLQVHLSIRLKELGIVYAASYLGVLRTILEDEKDGHSAMAVEFADHVYWSTLE